MRTTACVTAASLLSVLLAAATWCAPAKPAVVKLPKGDFALELTFEDGTKLNVTNKGTPLRAGTYTVKSLCLYKKDEKNRVWELHGAGPLGTMDSVTVEAEQEKILDPGPPIAFRVGAYQPKDRPGAVVIEVMVHGKYGEGYYPGAFLGRNRPPAPAFRVLNDAGKTVLAGEITVGKGAGGSYVWNPPAGLTGKFKIEVKPFMGPFEWATVPREFELK